MKFSGSKWSDVDFANNLIWLTTQKRSGGMEERDALPMTEQLRKALLRHRLKYGHQEYVFINPGMGKPYRERNHWLPSLCKKARVEPFNYHSIRHLVASMLDKHNVPLTTIQQILRHKNVTTTARYLHELTGVKVVLDKIFKCKILKFSDVKLDSTSNSNSQLQKGAENV